MSGGDEPRGSSAQPSEALRELTDVQRRSVAAASELFERLIEEVAGRTIPRLATGGALRGVDKDGDKQSPLTQMRASVERAIDLYADLLGETFQLYADAIDRIVAGRGSVALPSVNGSPVELTAAPGQEAATAVWLHNTTASPLTGVRLRMTDLAAHDGGTLDGVRGVFSPAAIDVAAGSSVSTTLVLALPAHAPAGAYHGLVLAFGLPAASIPVLLVVE